MFIVLKTITSEMFNHGNHGKRLYSIGHRTIDLVFGFHPVPRYTQDTLGDFEK